jgi:hypothetical protein
MAGEVEISGDDDPYPLGINNLKIMRAMLVEERRKVVAVGLSLREHNGEGGLRGAEIKILQEQIEAVDRAIKDEESLQPSVYETRGMIG